MRIDHQEKRLIWFGVFMTVLGCALRITAARGDLWLDEITSLRLVSAVHSPGGIFWGINNDNNHFLNSLYLYEIGPDHSSVVLRVLSILLGTATVPAAALAAGGFRRPTASALAMLLFAVSYPMVHYGSEARGYAGLILFVLVTTGLVARPPTVRTQLLLGLSIVLGCLSHLIMAIFVLALVFSVFVISFGNSRKIQAASARTVELFLIPGTMTVVTGVFILAHMPPGAFRFGTTDPATWANMTAGYGWGLELIMGFHDLKSPWVFIPVFAALVFLCRRMVGGQAEWTLFALTIVGLPGVLFVLHPANFETTRYYLPSLTMALLFLATTAATMMAGSRRARRIALACLALWMVGNGLSLARFYADGRGHYADAVRDMTAHGAATYGDKVPFGIGTVADYYAARDHVPLTQIALAQWCSTPPAWLVRGSNPVDPFPPVATTGPEACPQMFDTPVIYSIWGLSGWEWTVYKHRESQ